MELDRSSNSSRYFNITSEQKQINIEYKKSFYNQGVKRSYLRQTHSSFEHIVADGNE